MRHREGYYLAETNTYHQHISNSKTACIRTERQEVGAEQRVIREVEGRGG